MVVVVVVVVVVVIVVVVSPFAIVVVVFSPSKNMFISIILKMQWLQYIIFL